MSRHVRSIRLAFSFSLSRLNNNAMQCNVLEEEQRDTDVIGIVYLFLSLEAIHGWLDGWMGSLERVKNTPHSERPAHNRLFLHKSSSQHKPILSRAVGNRCANKVFFGSCTSFGRFLGTKSFPLFPHFFRQYIFFPYFALQSQTPCPAPTSLAFSVPRAAVKLNRTMYDIVQSGTSSTSQPANHSMRISLIRPT